MLKNQINGLEPSSILWITRNKDLITPKNRFINKIGNYISLN